MWILQYRQMAANPSAIKSNKAADFRAVISGSCAKK